MSSFKKNFKNNLSNLINELSCTDQDAINTDKSELMMKTNLSNVKDKAKENNLRSNTNSDERKL